MLTGGCLCGGVRYAAEEPSFDETICYCGDCRRAVGAVAVAWFTVPRAALRVVEGATRDYRSSPGVTRSFCGDCGTSLFYATDRLPGEIDVTTGSLDDPGIVPPKDHVCAASRPDWLAIGDGLPIHPGSRSGDGPRGIDRGNPP